VLWVFESPVPFSGGPAVAADGTLYVASEEAIVYALNPDGESLWQAELPAPAVASPALGAAGEIYVADKKGGLSSFGQGGELSWRFQPEKQILATTGPSVGPDGTIYYAVGRNMVAVSPEGVLIWETSTPPGTYRVSPPRLTPSGELLFWQEVIFRAEDGSIQEYEDLAEADEFFVGADGRLYLRTRHTVTEWRLSGSQPELLQSAAWDSGRIGEHFSPGDAGVTRDRTVWILYASSIVWLSTDGRVYGSIGNAFGPGVVIGVDEESTIYVCGVASPWSNPHPGCFAFGLGAEEPLWAMEFEAGASFDGGAQVTGRVYAAFSLEGGSGGILYAVGDSQR
jgi:outer membrane protein assembly factor BamB